MGQKLVALAVAALSTIGIAKPARATEPPRVDWMSLLSQLDRLARGTSERPTSTTSSRTVAHPAPVEEPSPQNMGNAWFGVAPRVTLVARDWTSSTLLAGDRMSLVEQMRLAASTRMVVGRARLNHARFTPFVQAGIGQWRIDRRYLPLTPSQIEVAAQLGTGFELRITRSWQLAAEAAATTLIVDRQTGSLPQTTLWSTFLASRIEF